MSTARPPRVVLTALGVAALGVVVNQAAGVAWLLVMIDVTRTLPVPGTDEPLTGLNAVSGVVGGLGGAGTGVALWALVGWGLWRGLRWGRAGATVLGGSLVLFGLAPLAALPLARRLLPDSVDLPGLGSPAVVLGVVAALLVVVSLALLWSPRSGAWFRRDLVSVAGRPDGRPALRS